MDWKSKDFRKGFVLGCVVVLVLVFIFSKPSPKYQIATGENNTYVINTQDGHIWQLRYDKSTCNDLGTITKIARNSR